MNIKEQNTCDQSSDSANSQPMSGIKSERGLSRTKIRSFAAGDCERACVITTQQTPSSEEEIGAKGNYDVSCHIVEICQSFETCEANISHYVIDNYSRRCDRGKRASVRPISDHNGHKECRNTNLSGDGHCHRRYQRSSRDIARSR